MGLLDSIIGTVGGKTDSGGANALVGVLAVSCNRVGDCKAWQASFRKAAVDVFSSWVGLGENHSISSNQVQNCLGSDQVKALAAKMGIDPAQASTLLAEFLPKVVDKLTPTGKVDPNADHQQGLAATDSGIVAASQVPALRGRKAANDDEVCFDWKRQRPSKRKAYLQVML